METFIVEMIIAFVSSFLLSNWLKSYFKKAGLVGLDVHKKNKPKLPTSGGIPVFFGFYVAAMLYIFLRTYIYGEFNFLLEILASILSIALVTFVGFLDDVNSAEGKRTGLKQWQKPLMTIWAALPLMALRLGTPKMMLPFIGNINLSFIYPLFIIPIAFMGASNMVNLLGGFNGLESGMAIIYLTSLSLYTYFYSNLAAKIIAFGALGAISGFFLFNKFPSKFLPGDSITYFLGATLATIAIVGNVEKAAIIISIPFIIEGLLKLRGRFKKPTIGILKNGKIHRQDGIYSLPHIFMNGNFTEKQIVQFTWAISAFFSILVWFV